MATKLARFIVIKHHYSELYVNYKDDDAGVENSGFLVADGETVLDTHSKIEVEPSKTGNHNHVHLRFCHSNKYFQQDDSYIFARSNQPDEDTSKRSCTLFEATIVNDEGLFHLVHVYSGARVGVLDNKYLVLNQDTDDNFNDSEAFDYVDWDTLVKMPERVAFQGDNGNYLEGVIVNGHPFLKFSSGDPNREASGHEVQMMRHGYVRIKSDRFGNFWRRSPNWIWADSTDTTSNDNDTLFWLVKVNETTIGIRNMGNNKFCERLSAEHNYDCLNAAASTITNEARLQVQELIMDRKIYDVQYRMEDSRIFGEMPYLAGSTSLTNEGETVASMAASITFADSKSYTFSRSMSLTAGVKTTFETGVPFIADGKIEVSYQISESLKWDETTTTTTSITASGSVPIPARSSAIVDYIGTQGTCNVPYTYTQEDKSSTDGRISHIEQIDGIYTGVNCYNFSFHVRAAQPL